MFDKETIEALETGELMRAVDDLRLSHDLFKLRPELRGLLDTRYLELRAAAQAASLREGDRAGAQLLVRAASDRLEALVRAVYRWVWGLVPEWVPDDSGTEPRISEANRLQALTALGFVRGKLGDFTDKRTMAIAEVVLAPEGELGLPVPLPASLVGMIAEQVAIIRANAPIATGGSREVAVRQRNLARELMEEVIARVRFAYCSASDAGDRTPELARIGLQPRRHSGEAQPAPLPGAPGNVTFDAARKTLSVAEKPAHATSLRAFRKPPGGQAELCGSSTSTTVSLVQASPPAEGVTYTAWLVGHNAEGDGPESAPVTFTG